jgi:hypothetical protein
MTATQELVVPRSIPIDAKTVMPLSLEYRHVPGDLSDRIAYGLTRMLRFFADFFFRKRYGHRAVVLETVAAVPGHGRRDAEPSEKPAADEG